MVGLNLGLGCVGGFDFAALYVGNTERWSLGYNKLVTNRNS